MLFFSKRKQQRSKEVLHDAALGRAEITRLLFKQQMAGLRPTRRLAPGCQSTGVPGASAPPELRHIEPS